MDAPDHLSEATARAINAEPWEPLPGMVKRQCLQCFYFFAAPGLTAELCPDCAAGGVGAGRNRRASTE